MYNSFGKYKTTSHVQVFIGLCMAFCFILCSSNHITKAAVNGLYPIKTDNTLGYNFNNRIDQGFSSAQMVLSQYNTSNNNDYYEHVFSLVDVAISNADSYFSFPLTINFDKNDFILYFKSIDPEYSFNREYFLNVYLCVDSSGNANVYCQYNKGYGGFLGSTLTYFDHDGNDYVPVYELINSVSFWYPEYNSSDYLDNDLIYVASDTAPLNGFNNFQKFMFLPLGFSNTYDLSNSNISTFSSFKRNSSFSCLELVSSNLNHNYFFIPIPSNGSYTIYRALKSSYILPLYIDSNIYTPTSFISPIENNIDIKTRLIDWNSITYLVYYPYRSAMDYPQYFRPELWYTSSFGSGILQSSNTPDPIVTPFPTFGPIYSPTPFPTITINATLTPIAIPNDPYIRIGNADPISTVTGVISYLMTMFATPFFGFVKYTLQYVYNSSVYWQILMFLIPGVVLIAFLIGRLKRK